MAEVLYGAPVREKIKKELIERVSSLSFKPSLRVLQVGDRPDSTIYVRNKQKFGEEIGVEVIIKNFKEDVSEEDLIEEIEKINNAPEVNALIVQLPLPERLNTEKILKVISKEKDADGLKEGGDGSLLVTPATARATERLIDFYRLDTRDKKIAVIGRSRLAGGPIATMLQKRGADVTVCHRDTTNTPEICQDSDMIVSAAGQANLVTEEFVRPGQTVIDIGINRISENQVVGDVDFEKVKDIVSAITPVPLGIGPLTVACLFENILDLVSKRGA